MTELERIEKDIRDVKKEINNCKKSLKTAITKNLIKDNRIVNDQTFALRLKSFLSNVHVYNPISGKEKDYLIGVANKLLDYQIFTATELDEILKIINSCKI